MGPGGASAKWSKNGHIITALERGQSYEISGTDGDYYRILIPAYVHVNYAAVIKEREFRAENMPFIGPDINNLSDLSDGSYECVQMMARYAGITVEASRTIRKISEIFNILSSICEQGIKYFPEPPFIAQVAYHALMPMKRQKKIESYLMVLEINDREILTHDPMDFEGGYKRFLMNDFLLAYRGNSIWLK